MPFGLDLGQAGERRARSHLDFAAKTRAGDVERADVGALPVSSRLMSRPSSGRARAIQIIESPPSAPISKALRAPAMRARRWMSLPCGAENVDRGQAGRGIGRKRLLKRRIRGDDRR